MRRAPLDVGRRPRITALALVAAIVGAVGLAAGATAATTSTLDKVVLRAAQVGDGYRMSVIPDGRKVGGQVTLDMCGFPFTSEALRTKRLQVAYQRRGSPFDHVSNEVVAYRANGARRAFEEIAFATAHCPPGPVSSAVRGVPPLVHRVKRLAVAGLEPASMSFQIRILGTYQGQPIDETGMLVFQRRKSVLSAIYIWGSSATARLKMATRLGRASATNLRDAV